MKKVVDFEKPINIECNIYNACRTNTARAQTNDMHYDMEKLAHISGANFDNFIRDLQWCAENGEDGYAVEAVKHFAESLLSAYEIQSTSYKRYPNGK